MKIYLALLLTSLSLYACTPTSPQEDCTAFLEKSMELQMKKRIQEMSLEAGLQRDTLDPATPLYSRDGQQLTLATLLNQGNLLLFRYSNLSCNACNLPTLQAIEDFKNQHPDTRMAIIASYDSLRTFSSFCRTYTGTVPVYFLYPRYAKGVFRAEIPPYLCLALSDNSIQSPFVIPSEVDGIVEAYLAQITPFLK